MSLPGIRILAGRGMGSGVSMAPNSPDRKWSPRMLKPVQV
jgi:hypothetical protein